MCKFQNHAAILVLCLFPGCAENGPVDERVASTNVAGEQPESERGGNRPAIERADSATLFEAAAVLYGKDKIENAGFLFYVAQLRGRIDLEAYPPVGTGGDSPGVALAAVREPLGWRINPAAMRDRDVFARIVERMSKWTPAFDASYDPGWEYKSAMSEAEFNKLAAEVKTLWLEQMRGFAELLQDDEYYRLFRKVQDYNLAEVEGFSPDSGSQGSRTPISEKEYAAAVKRLEEIEQSSGTRFGVFTPSKGIDIETDDESASETPPTREGDR